MYTGFLFREEETYAEISVPILFTSASNLEGWTALVKLDSYWLLGIHLRFEILSVNGKA